MPLNRTDIQHNRCLIRINIGTNVKHFMMLTTIWIVSYLRIMAKVVIMGDKLLLKILARNFSLNL